MYTHSIQLLTPCNNLKELETYAVATDQKLRERERERERAGVSWN
jgi:hypothetical protein